MNKFRSGLILIFVCCVLLTTEINSENDSATFSATLATAETNPDFDRMEHILGNSYVPRSLSEVLQASHEKYLEGCDLVQTGESEKAQICFNEAVDLLLSPNWDRTSTQHLNLFFQELIQRIPEEKSFYTSDSNGNSGIRNLIPLKISPSLEKEFFSPLGGTSYEIPITLNKTVAKSLYYWLNDGRMSFVDGLRRSGRYRPIIERILCIWRR